MAKNDHTAFQVSDMDSAIRFYTKCLGLRLISSNVNPAEQEAYSFLELEGGNLELIQKLDRPFRPPEIEPPYCPHFAIETGDMAQVVDMAKRNGIRIVAGPLEVPGEEKWIYLSDPDNNVIEYIEWSRKKRG
jgi:catechol 2,3-dioxygenase-like lactoylglutathione lyase family enzyme